MVTPTRTQMEADAYYRAEVVPFALDWLGDELCRLTGRPRSAAGTKGDWLHRNGAHRSQRFILLSQWCTNRTYTVDPGVTGDALNWVSGFDFTPGSVTAMIEQCKRLIAAMKAGLLDEVEAVYGNVDGDQVVDGWDNVRDLAATSDTSHLWHWHLTIKRQFANSMDLMRRILGYALGTLPIIKGVINMGMHVLAKRGDQVYLCDGQKSRPVPADAVQHVKYLGEIGAISLFTGPTPGGEMVDGVWNGWGPEIFGPLDSAGLTLDQVKAAVREVVEEEDAIELDAEDVAARVDAKLAARLAA